MIFTELSSTFQCSSTAIKQWSSHNSLTATCTLMETRRAVWHWKVNSTLRNLTGWALCWCSWLALLWEDFHCFWCGTSVIPNWWNSVFLKKRPLQQQKTIKWQRSRLKAKSEWKEEKSSNRFLFYHLKILFDYLILHIIWSLSFNFIRYFNK